jgi:hypothetical protein
MSQPNELPQGWNWDFIELHHPKYYGSEMVAHSNQIMQYLNGDHTYSNQVLEIVGSLDIEMVRAKYIQINTQLWNEAMENAQG